MKGYKGMDANMRCRGMQYEVGKSYHVDGDINICSNGLHFCENLSNVFDFYQRDGNRFFEVEASGTIKTGRNKSAASDLMIYRELSDIEINRIIYGYGDGYGDGNGYGNGSGSGNGDGWGDGWGDGYGYGSGSGNGDGWGSGWGYGSGWGNIQKILMFV